MLRYPDPHLEMRPPEPPPWQHPPEVANGTKNPWHPPGTLSLRTPTSLLDPEKKSTDLGLQMLFQAKSHPKIFCEVEGIGIHVHVANEMGCQVLKKFSRKNGI